MGNDILVVAFDGLDKELIKEFDLGLVERKDFGSIDNSTNISSIKTSELFASFITGSSYEEHGVEGIVNFNYNLRGRIIDFVVPNFLRSNVRGFFTLKEILKLIFNVEKVGYSKESIEAETLFDRIENSRAMFVPTYESSKIWKVGDPFNLLQKGFTVKETVNFWDTREYRFRKQSLFDELESDIIGSRDFLMCHFHRPDFYQHMFGDKDIGRWNKSELKKLYNETDVLADEIQKMALEAGYDYVIFMSDHGLPTEDEHNENAFYCCNKDLFGSETPRITDFYDKILELVEE